MVLRTRYLKYLPQMQFLLDLSCYDENAATQNCKFLENAATRAKKKCSEKCNFCLRFLAMIYTLFLRTANSGLAMWAVGSHPVENTIFATGFL